MAAKSTPALALPDALVAALKAAGWSAPGEAAPAPAKSAPARKAKAESPFIVARRERKAALLADGEHKRCTNCGNPINIARSTERGGGVVCRTCVHAGPAEFRKRHARAVAQGYLPK